MKRLLPAAAVLITLGSPVCAADSFSFAIGGHRIRIEAPNHCRSMSCLSMSIPGITRHRSQPNDGNRATASSTLVQAPASAVSAANNPVAKPAVCAPPSAAPRPAAVTTQQAVVPLPIQPPRVQTVQATSAAPVTTAAITPPPPPPLPQSPPPPPSPPQQIVHPAEVAPPVSNETPKIAKVSHQVEEEPADTPLGDWQAEGQKGIVRIEPCGQALCGYIVDPASNATGETVLIDMKSKTASQWSGNIYSRETGNTYYGTIAMKGADSLRVEACAFGRFFCSGNLWSRIGVAPKSLVTDRSISQEPRT